ncbi:MAG: hypothetical protein HUK02_05790, partial [Bacteroidaceae bacterium]|nr:hypothetical protein [Bacteroidaceae bacterium]
MEKGINEYLQGRTLGPQAQKQLEQMVSRYPYFQAARLLWLRSLYQQHDESFGVELRRAALSIPSREAIFQFLEKERMKAHVQDTARRKFGSAAPDRTSSLIGEFLETLPDVSDKPKHRAPAPDASTDYLGFLLQTDPENPILGSTPSAEGSHGDFLIENFLDNNKKIEIVDRSDDELQLPQLEDDNDAENDVCTEIMSSIY